MSGKPDRRGSDDVTRQELRPEPRELPRREGTFDGLVEEVERAPAPEELAATTTQRKSAGEEGGDER